MKRLKVCENRLEAESIVHALGKEKIVALVRAYAGTDVIHQGKLEVMVNADDLARAQKIID